MGTLTKIFSNLREYFRSLAARRKRRKASKDDPYIYPHF